MLWSLSKTRREAYQIEYRNTCYLSDHVPVIMEKACKINRDSPVINTLLITISLQIRICKPKTDTYCKFKTD